MRFILFVRFLLFFARIFLRTFISFTFVVSIYLTIVLFVVFIFFITVLTLPLLCTCAYIFVGNVHAIKRHIVWIQVIFSNVIKITYVLVNEPEKIGLIVHWDIMYQIDSKCWSNAVHAHSYVDWHMVLHTHKC